MEKGIKKRLLQEEHNTQDIPQTLQISKEISCVFLPVTAS